MNRKRGTVGPWIPTERERAVAETLAVGYSQNRAGEILGIPQPNISKMWQRPEFQQLVADLNVQFMRNRDNVHEQQVTLAQMMVYQGLTGERDADTDASVRLAERLLASTYWHSKRGEKRKKFGDDTELPPAPQLS